MDCCHDHVILTSDLQSPSSNLRSLVSDIGLRPRPTRPDTTIIAVIPSYLFSLGLFGLHQSLYLYTARMTPSITERSTSCRTLRTLDTIDTLTVLTLPNP
jgi:hypothetical protein